MSVLAIDIGSSRIKAMLAGWDGRLIDARATTTPRRALPTGERSYPLESVHAAIEDLVRQVAVGHPGSPVDTLVFSCLGTAMAPVAADGRPLGPALAPTDTRPQGQSWRVDELGIGLEELRHRTGSDPAVASFLLHALWWQAERPEIIDQTYRFRSLRGYALERLCKADVEDRTWASRTMLADLDTNEWSAAILSAAGLPRSLLPSIEPPTATFPILGEVIERLSLAPGARAVIGAMDNGCSLFGAAGEGRSGLVNIVGTYEHMAGAASLRAVRQVAESSDAVVHSYLLEGQYVAMTRVPIGDLLARAMAGESATPESMFDQLSPQPRGRSLALEAAAVDRAVDAGRSRSDILQDVLEASVAVLARFADAWAALGLPAEPIAAVGGGAGHDAILRLKATLLGRSLVTLASAEGASLGALRLAAVAVEGCTAAEACRLFGNPIEHTVRPWSAGPPTTPQEVTST